MDFDVKPKKERYEVGLSDEEAILIREIAAAENRAFAEVLGEIIRLGLPIKLDSLAKAAAWRKTQKRDRLYQRLTQLSESEIDQVLKSVEPDGE